MIAVGILAVSTGMASAFAVVVLRHLTAATGVVTASSVEVRPGRVLGLTFAGPNGRYPLSAFRTVPFQRSAADVDIFASAGRVILVGTDAPEILIARASRLDPIRALRTE